MVSTDIVQEKTTKAIETILTSMSPETHFTSKVTGVLIFSIISAIALIIISLITEFLGSLIFGGNIAGASSDVVDLDPNSITNLLGSLNLVGGIFILILSLILGFAFIIIITGFMASFASGQEDVSATQTPIMLFNLVGFYMAMYLPLAGTTGMQIVKILSFIPFFTPYVLPALVITNNMSILVALIPLAILLICVFLICKFLMPVYKISILNYDNGKLFKKIKLTIKESRNRKLNVPKS
jgi:ABC-2 type transport system permease protein